MMAGPGSSTMADAARGRFISITPLGDDLRIDMVLDI
jgi:hypothetical protein